jgi:hypothetical protein
LLAKAAASSTSAAGISDATTYRFFGNQEFVSAFRTVRRLAFDEALCALEKGANKAAQRLVDEFDDATASTVHRNQVFINGAKAILDRAFKAQTTIAVDEELAELRSLMAKLKAGALVNVIYVPALVEENRIAKD